MPELPEVETIRRDLQRVILGKEITDVEIRTKRLVQSDPIMFLATLTRNSFNRIERRGKLLQFHLQHSDRVLHWHLKMTGQIIAQVHGGIIVGGHPMAKIDDLPNAYTHVIFTFEDGTKLFFNDVRTFGYVKLVEPSDHATILERFGVEPLHPDFTWDHFQTLIAKRKTKVKAFLLNQALIAGIGNIYADEICFRAKVRPTRTLNSLTLAEQKRLFNACRVIISQAVEKRGTTFSNFVDAAGKKGGYMPYLRVYGRGGRLCLRCEEVNIVKTVLAGRGTTYCPNCQT